MRVSPPSTPCISAQTWIGASRDWCFARWRWLLVHIITTSSAPWCKTVQNTAIAQRTLSKSPSNNVQPWPLSFVWKFICLNLQFLTNHDHVNPISSERVMGVASWHMEVSFLSMLIYSSSSSGRHPIANTLTSSSPALHRSAWLWAWHHHRRHFRNGFRATSAFTQGRAILNRGWKCLQIPGKLLVLMLILLILILLIGKHGRSCQKMILWSFSCDFVLGSLLRIHVLASSVFPVRDNGALPVRLWLPLKEIAQCPLGPWLSRTPAKRPAWARGRRRPEQYA